MNRLFLSLLFTGTLASAATLAAAQAPAAATGTLAGTVADSLTRQPLPFATVVLRQEAGPVRSTITDERGAYRFAGLPAGSYTLAGQYLGYRAGQPVAVAMSAAAVPAVALALAPARQQLAEVKVTAARPFIELLAGKVVLNVAASPLAAGGTAAEVIARAPGVLEQNGGYELRGRSVEVLLDGRPTHLSGEELKNLLAALPASSLDRVELIANPSAKYDAKGGAILNLVTTKGLKLGTNGIATLGAGAGRYGRLNAGLSLNHRTARLNVYGSFDRLDNQVYASTSAQRPLDQEGQLTETSYETRRNANNAAKLGLDYELGKTASAGILVRGLLNERTRQADALALLGGADGTLRQRTELASAGTLQVLSPSLSAYYKTTLGAPARTLRLGADYFGYAKNTSGDYATTAYAADGTALAATELRRDHSPARNAVRSATLDYAQPLAGGTLEAGLKATATTTDSDLRWELSQPGQHWAVDAGRTNHFVYQENIYAAYATYARSYKKLALEAGLRVEQTATTGTSLTLGQATERRYLDLFPSASVQLSQSEKSQWGLSYRRRIDRFQFGTVNPFLTYLSPYRYQQGNPAIRPSYSHNFELSHTYGTLLSTALSYAYHTDVLIGTYQKNELTQVVTTSYENFRSADELNATLTLMKSLLAGKWQTVTTLGATYARVSAALPGLGSARPAAFLSTNHTLTLPAGFRAELSAAYSSPMTFGGLAIRASFVGGAGVSKTVLGGAGTLTLNVTDIFNTQQRRAEVLAAGLSSYEVSKAESRFIRLNFSYKFGNKNVKASQRRDTGIEAEKARMEN